LSRQAMPLSAAQNRLVWRSVKHFRSMARCPHGHDCVDRCFPCMRASHDMTMSHVRCHISQNIAQKTAYVGFYFAVTWFDDLDREFVRAWCHVSIASLWPQAVPKSDEVVSKLREELLVRFRSLSSLPLPAVSSDDGLHFCFDEDTGELERVLLDIRIDSIMNGNLLCGSMMKACSRLGIEAQHWGCFHISVDNAQHVHAPRPTRPCP